MFERTGGAGGGRVRGPGIPLWPPPWPDRGPLLVGGTDGCGGVPDVVIFVADSTTGGGAALPRLPPSSIRWEPVELMLVCFRETPLFDLKRMDQDVAT